MGKWIEYKKDCIREENHSEVMDYLYNDLLPKWSKFFSRPIEDWSSEWKRKMPYPYSISPYYPRYFKYIHDSSDDKDYTPFPRAFFLCRFFWASDSIYEFRISAEEIEMWSRSYMGIKTVLGIIVQDKINEILENISGQEMNAYLNGKVEDLFDPKDSRRAADYFYNNFMKREVVKNE